MSAQVRIYHYSLGADNQISSMEIFQIILCEVKSTEVKCIASLIVLKVPWTFLLLRYWLII